MVWNCNPTCRIQLIHKEGQKLRQQKTLWLYWFSFCFEGKGGFNDISTPYGLFNAEIRFICKCFIIIITIFNIPLQSFFFLSTIIFYLCLNYLFILLYGIKHSYPIQINFKISTHRWDPNKYYHTRSGWTWE